LPSHYEFVVVSVKDLMVAPPDPSGQSLKIDFDLQLCSSETDNEYQYHEKD